MWRPVVSVPKFTTHRASQGGGSAEENSPSRSFSVHFSWIIVAFALGFFVMMRDVERPDAGLKDKSRFDSPLRAASKASVMLVGEVDFNEYNEKVGATGPWWDQMLSHVFLLLFVFLLAVVLMNMLGALAVDEIKGIRRDSEVAVRKSVVDTLLYYTEFLLEWLPLRLRPPPRFKQDHCAKRRRPWWPATLWRGKVFNQIYVFHYTLFNFYPYMVRSSCLPFRSRTRSSTRPRR